MRGGLVPSISGILTAYSSSHRVTGTPRAFLSGEGALSLPPQALFHTHLCLLPAPGVVVVVVVVVYTYIYICEMALGAPTGVQAAGARSNRDAEFRALLRELPETLR